MERILDAYRHHPRYHHYADLIEFLFLTAARTGEAVALFRSDIDFEKGVIHIRKTIAYVRGKPDPRDTTKTGKNREFPIEDPALEKLLRRVCSAIKSQVILYSRNLTAATSIATNSITLGMDS